MRKGKISSRSIERLCIYRRALLAGGEGLGPTVFSHQVAAACQLTAAQVRRDLMAIGYSGSPNTGYEVRRLLKSIAVLLDPPEERGVAIVGMGYLGRAIATYLVGRLPTIRLAAAFDVDTNKIGQTYNGVICHSVVDLSRVASECNISLGILTVPGEVAQEAALMLSDAGIIGILNFAPVCLQLPKKTFVENIDMTVALGKVAFFARGIDRKKGKSDEHSS
jgi:redox-sensing transcriptional repressor